MQIKKVEILNPTKPNRSTGILRGSASGILNWNDLLYPHIYTLREQIRNRFYISSEYMIPSESVEMLQEAEISQLVLLAHQITYIAELESHVADYMNDPSVVSVFSTLYDQAGEHLVSLQRILSLAQDHGHQVTDRHQGKYFKAKSVLQKLNEDPTEENLLNSISYLKEKTTDCSGIYEYFVKIKLDGISDLVEKIYEDQQKHEEFLVELHRILYAESLGRQVSVPEHLKEDEEESTIEEEQGTGFLDDL